MGYVKAGTDNSITTIEFYDPQSNSLPERLLEDLARAIANAGKQASTRAIILRSAGDRAFCAGASFNELMSIISKEQGLKFFSGFAHVINAMRKCPQFIIARIQGKCVGGGVGLAAAADYAIAQHGADIRLSELAVGIGPFVVGPAVERKMGLAAFGHLAIDASSWKDATWARSHGLYAELYDSREEMDAAIEKLAATLAASSPDAMREMKTMLWQGTDHWDTLLIERAAISGELVLSNFTREAIERFKSK